MTSYNPPRENVPIFDSSLFVDAENGGGLSRAEADSLYVHYPFAQGPVTFQGQNNIVVPTCSAVQPAPTDNSTKIPTTAWVQSAIAGGGSFISLQQITPTATLTDIIVPAGTQWCRIFAIGWGGVAGANTTVQGGGGGAGSSIIWPNLPVGNTSGAPLAVFSSVILGADNSYALSWASSYSTGQRIATVGAGQVGNPAVGSVTGAGGAGGKIDNNNFFGQAGNSIGGQSGGVIPQAAQLPALLNYFYKTLALGVGSGGYNAPGLVPVAPTAGRIYIWSYA
jgi:hypothetical protein